MFSRISRVRLIFAIALFASVVFAPWWVAAALAVLIAARFRAWEVIGAGLLYDLLWLPAAAFTSYDVFPLATIVAVALVFILEPLRRQLLIG